MRTSKSLIRDPASYLAAIVDSSGDAIIGNDLNGIITSWNLAAEGIFGYTASEVIGRSISILAAPGVVDEMPSILAQIRNGETVAHYETDRCRKDGTRIPVSLTASPIRDSFGRIGGASKIVRDISDRKRAERDLQRLHEESERRTMELEAEISRRKNAEGYFRLVVEAAPNAMIMVDAEGRIALINSRTEKLFGYERQELLGQPVEILVPERFRTGHLDHRSGFLGAPAVRAVGTGRELFGVRKDGSEVPIEIGLNPIDGQRSFVLASVIDITERKRAQAALSDVHRLLELRVRELSDANRELAKKNEEVEAFVYIVSHDLRAPLVNLQGFSKELEMSCEELRQCLLAPEPLNEGRFRTILDEDIPSSLRYISGSATKFQRLIEALLQLSRYGRQQYRSEELDLSSLVQTTLDSMRVSIAASGAHVSAGPIPPAFGDATAIGQVFSNLIGNSLKYLQPGRPGLIEIGGEIENGFAHCWVRDNGAGFPPSAKPRLFQVFQRFHPDLAPGDGMGLAIVRRIVEHHGGKVWAESEEHVGTTFHFTLPGERAPHR